MNKLLVKQYTEELNPAGFRAVTYVNRIWKKYLNLNLNNFLKNKDIGQSIIDYNQHRKQQLMDDYCCKIIYTRSEMYIEFETAEDMMQFILEWS